jgi:uncharacterized membrane-anchored protein YitT (DUF2179 family)
MKKTLNTIAVVLGVAFILLALVYWLTPANGLPAYLPGYNVAMTTPHFKHGIAAFVVGLVLFAFAWFNSAKKVS